MNTSIEKWVSLNDICSHLGASRDTVIKMVKFQGMPAYQVGRKWKFKISEVDLWMSQYKKIGCEVNDNAKNN